MAVISVGDLNTTLIHNFQRAEASAGSLLWTQTSDGLYLWGPSEQQPDPFPLHLQVKEFILQSNNLVSGKVSQIKKNNQ